MKHNYPSILKFQQWVELKDYRPATKKEYVRYVCKLAEHFQCDPATLTENQIREYFLFLRQHKHYKAAPMKAAKYSRLAFFLDCVQVKGWTGFKEVRIAEPQVLPLVLSRCEVQSLLQAVVEPRFRTTLHLMYHCGLRVGETVGIEVRDIHGRVNPPRVHVPQLPESSPSSSSRPLPTMAGDEGGQSPRQPRARASGPKTSAHLADRHLLSPRSKSASLQAALRFAPGYLHSIFSLGVSILSMA